MKQKELRIVLPMTVEEYHIAQLYMVAKTSEEQTGDGEGVEIIKNEPFENENEKGQYTEKIIHLGSKLPGWVKTLMPSLKKLALVEKAWNCFPKCRTVYTCDFFGEKFALQIETVHLDDDGSSENVHGLPEKDWKNVKVDYVDIAEDPIDPKEYKEAEDPCKFKSDKTGRGPLQSGWRKTTTPLMTCYKLVTCEFKYWGIQSKSESAIQKSAVRDVVLNGHRKLFCWMDEWHGMTIEDIRDFEETIKMRLARRLQNASRVSIGSKAEADALKDAHVDPDEDDDDEKKE